MPGPGWIRWSTVAAVVLVAALASGCGATSESSGSSDSGRIEPSAACLADELVTFRPAKAPDAHLTDEERKRAEAQGREVGEEPSLNAYIVELIMQEYGVSADQAMHQNEIQARVIDDNGLDRDVRAAAGAHFAEIWFDGINEGKYTVGVTPGADVDAIEAALSNHGMSDDSAVFVVESTEAELDRAQDAVADVVEVTGDGPASVGSSTVGNCIIVDVSNKLTDAQVDAIEHAADGLGVAVLVTQLDESQLPHTD